ncbi:MAG: hypothetical protein PVF68_13260 [Acidobacteriota bacterium]|jgi:hypothetical protein
MPRIPQTVVQLDGILGHTRFTLGDRDVSVEQRRPFFRRRASYPFDTFDRKLGLEERPHWAYLVAVGLMLPGIALALRFASASGSMNWTVALSTACLVCLAGFLLHRRRRMVFRNYFTSATLFEMTPSVATTPVGKQIVNRVVYADSAGLPRVFNYVEFEGGRKLVCSAEHDSLERLFFALLEAIPDEVGVALVVVRGDREEAEYGNGHVRRDRVRRAFEEYRDILTLDGMADFCVYREGDFELVLDNHRVIEIYGEQSPFLPILEAQGFVFNRSYSPRYLHYHVHNVNPPENFDERVEQLKWNLQLR